VMNVICIYQSSDECFFVYYYLWCLFKEQKSKLTFFYVITHDCHSSTATSMRETLDVVFECDSVAW